MVPRLGRVDPAVFFQKKCPPPQRGYPTTEQQIPVGGLDRFQGFWPSAQAKGPNIVPFPQTTFHPQEFDKAVKPGLRLQRGPPDPEPH
ncbi:hypothetical protein ES703_103432 [subsurface metagenome]